MADLKISLVIPEALVTRVIEGIAYQHGYQDEIEGEDNPQSKGSFAKEKLLEWAKANVKAWEATQAANTARDAAIEDVDTDINLTTE